jgi:hypothetical protein
VSPAELADILDSGEYSVVPGGVKGKCFCLSCIDARYFRDRAILGAVAIVSCAVSDATGRLLEYGIFDQRPGICADLSTRPMVIADAAQYAGIGRLE